MSHIIIINDSLFGDGETNLQDAGAALAALSELHAAGDVDLTKGIPIDSIELRDRAKAGSDAADQMSAFAETLCMAEITPDGAEWHRTDAIGPGPVTQIEATSLKIRFVFEANDEQIIVVPKENSLKYGLYAGNVQDFGLDRTPPMAEAKYFNELPEARALLEKLRDDLIAQAQTSGGSLSETEIRTRADAHIDTVSPSLGAPAPSNQERKDLYLQQLAAYSVRQCQ